MLVTIYHTNPSHRGVKRELVTLENEVVVPLLSHAVANNEDEFKGVVLDYINNTKQFQERIVFDLDFIES